MREWLVLNKEMRDWLVVQYTYEEISDIVVLAVYDATDPIFLNSFKTKLTMEYWDS